MSPLPYPKTYKAVLLSLSFLALGWFNYHQIAQIHPVVAVESRLNASIRHRLKINLPNLAGRLKVLQQAKSSGQIIDFDAPSAQYRFDTVNLLLATDPPAAQQEFLSLDRETKVWQDKLKAENDQKEAALAARVLAAPTAEHSSVAIPILLYHKTPADFESQLKALVAKGYTAVDLDQVALALKSGEGLPGKPVVITFDDGFNDQMKAYALLKQYQMKATFYVISGGEASGYCIGANRHPNMQCGDEYLNWDQIRELDASGLVTIAGHTVDHVNLPQKTAEVQRFEIFTGKADIEAQLGHSIRHFAYPYGASNPAVTQLVREAGYATAVSTKPGISQTTDTIYDLHRVRSALTLP